MFHPEEESWIRRSQAGDREAFAALVECYWMPVCRLLSTMTQNAHAAEDLTQDVFLKAWSKLNTFKAGTHFRPWLFRIAHNTFLNSRRCGPFARQYQRLPDTVAARQADPVATLLMRETQTMVDDAVNRLPVKYRLAFLLRTREELPFPEIAEVLRVTAATARWHVFRARHLLVQTLGPLLDRKATVRR